MDTSGAFILRFGRGRGGQIPDGAGGAERGSPANVRATLLGTGCSSFAGAEFVAVSAGRVAWGGRGERVSRGYGGASVDFLVPLLPRGIANYIAIPLPSGRNVPGVGSVLSLQVRARNEASPASVPSTSRRRALFPYGTRIPETPSSTTDRGRGRHRLQPASPGTRPRAS